MARPLKLELYATEIITAYRQGMTLPELAKLYGCATGTVLNLLISHDEPRRKPGRQKGEVNDSNSKASEPDTV